MAFKLRTNTAINSKGFVLESHDVSIYIDEVDFCPSGRVGLLSNGRLIGFAGEWIAEQLEALEQVPLNNIKRKDRL